MSDKLSSSSERPDIKNELALAFEQFADAIFRHCYFRLSNREEAKDLTQQVFLQTWNYLAQGKKIENMRAFLYRVANNTIINYRQKKKALRFDDLEEAENLPGKETWSALENRERVEKFIRKLEARNQAYAQVITMRYLEDLPVQEIATLLGESENNISVRIHRALKLLKQIADQDDQV